MAFRPDLAASFFVVFVAVVLSSCVDLSTCSAVKGRVSCLDCNSDFDFSGIKVGVRCDGTKRPFTATTDENGLFSVEIRAQTPIRCLARLLGSTEQLYVKNKYKSRIIKAAPSEHNSYVVESPLEFSTACPSSMKSHGKCEAQNQIGSSKTVNLPVPPEWGLPPTSYYVPFIPIIGIP